MFRPILIVPPAELPVVTELCKKHTVVDYDDDDLLIDGYIHAACGLLDGFRGHLGRCIVNQTWQVEKRRFEREWLLPVPDVSAVAIEYSNAAGEALSVADTDYIFSPVSLGTRIRFKSAFEAPGIGEDSSIKLAFTAGYGASADVPWGLKVAIMQLVTHLHDDRSGAGGLPQSVLDLTAPFRWTRV
ncbi:head-tail connector protein [Pseudophaeobacter sp.]|uniref:head-tail connector protein n=1 Tax=Pseudophaeobacter sp. TaxID=1971739 RepID=UPI003A96D441